MRKFYFIILSVFLMFPFCSFSEDISAEKAGALVNERVQFAMSNPDYMVTAGDMYLLTYAVGSGYVNYSIPVDNTYEIKVANLATINGKGKTFLRLKKEVESIVNRNYPMGGVRFVLSQPALFNVFVKGEVKSARTEKVWAMTRLGEVFANNLTDYSSLRNVTVISKDGKKSSYDLYKCYAEGDFSQNPYLRPEDTIIVNRYDRKVTISGSVFRSGEYELLKGENLKALIEKYAQGFTDEADVSRIRLERSIGTETAGGKTLYLTKEDVDSDFVMNNQDRISIGSTLELRPFIEVEGIIQNPEFYSDRDKAEANAAESDKTQSFTVFEKFRDGENYATFVRRIAGLFTPYSDLKQSYIVRNDKKLAINIEEFLNNADLKSSLLLEKGDKLVIPYSQNFTNRILITGEVTSAVERNAWPLRRLSEHIDGVTTSYSSIRNIVVIDQEGNERTFDLFKAFRDSDMTQNPFVQSGETIRVNRYDRRVTVSGAVERPGTYELLPGEQINELIKIYGNGLRSRADMSCVELSRSEDITDSANQVIYLEEKDISDNFALLDMDTVHIRSFDELKPVVFLEGAVVVTQDNTALVSSNRRAVVFEKNEDYAFFVRRNRGLFTESSDLENAYIIRDNRNIPLNLQVILYDNEFVSGLAPEKYDTLIIPFKQSFVTVAGAVKNPGRYPYIPDRTWDYYVGLAGGFDKTQNHGEVINIRDKNNRKVSKNGFITPETTITAVTNAPTYYFSIYAPVVTTLLSTVSTIFTIIAVTR